jgi:hypothetical protein
MGQGVAVGVVVLVLIALLAPLVRSVMMRGLGADSGFLIRRKAGGAIDVRGRVPRSKVPEIQEFCRRTLASGRPYTIRGMWGPGRSLNIRWTGDLSPAQRQRTRNYLLQCLN